MIGISVVCVVIIALVVFYGEHIKEKEVDEERKKRNELAKEYSAFKQQKWDEMWEQKSNQKRDLELVLKRECDILFDRGESFGISSEDLHGMIIENLSYAKIEKISDIYAVDFEKVAKIALYSHVGCLNVFDDYDHEESCLYRYDLNGNRIELTEAEASKMFNHDFDDLLEAIPLCDVLEAYKQGVTVGYDGIRIG